MYATRTSDRIKAGIATALIHIAIAIALFAGVWPQAATTLRDEGMSLLPLLRTPPPPPPPIVRTAAHRTHSKSGAASPPNFKARPVALVALEPVIPPPMPPPLVTAPKAGPGPDASAGAAAVAGPGFGAGGQGTGSGSGGDGDGDGDGGGDTPPRLLKGRLKNSDYPKAAGEAGVGGTVSVRYVVEADGRVSDCDITKSSGNAELDATTCRLIRERFRFDPSHDARGRPVASALVENHSWYIRHEDAPPDAR